MLFFDRDKKTLVKTTKNCSVLKLPALQIYTLAALSAVGVL
jgi:hypothetical protein